MRTCDIENPNGDHMHCCVTNMNKFFLSKT
jgi:hypothetical protein